MAIITVEIYSQGFDQMIVGLDKAPVEMRRKITSVGIDVVQEVWLAAEEKVPRRTGRLRASIGGKFDPLGGEWLGGVGVRMDEPPYGNVIKAHETASYAAIVEKGARKHLISAKGRRRGGKNALWWKGAAHPVRRIEEHPGQEGQHYLRNALLDKEQTIRRMFRDGVQDVLRRIKEGKL